MLNNLESYFISRPLSLKVMILFHHISGSEVHLSLWEHAQFLQLIDFLRFQITVLVLWEFKYERHVAFAVLSYNQFWRKDTWYVDENFQFEEELVYGYWSFLNRWALDAGNMVSCAVSNEKNLPFWFFNGPTYL
jgi:hypothetical protein